MHVKPLLLIGLAALAACDESTSGPDFAGVQLGDLQSRDATADLAIADVFCAQSCVAPAACCITPTLGGGMQAMCATSCPDGGVFAQCTGPSDCTPQTPSCCFTVNLMGNADAAVMSQGAEAMCSADCPAGLSGDKSSFNTKLCHAAGDCAGYSGDFGAGAEPFDGCCESPRAPAVRFCAPSRLSGSGGLSC